MKTLWITIALLSSNIAHAQQKMLNIPAIHQLVSHSETEYDRQNKARNKQSLVAASEQANLTLLEKTKVSYRDLQQRFNSLGTAINIAQLTTTATPMLNRIINIQGQIMALCRKNPALAATGFASELKFVTRSERLISYMAGLSLSLGDINQMKISDRKILFDFIISELAALQQYSGNLLNLMQYTDLVTMLKDANPFRSFVDADKQIVKEILQNAEYFK